MKNLRQIEFAWKSVSGSRGRDYYAYNVHYGLVVFGNGDVRTNGHRRQFRPVESSWSTSATFRSHSSLIPPAAPLSVEEILNDDNDDLLNRTMDELDRSSPNLPAAPSSVEEILNDNNDDLLNRTMNELEFDNENNDNNDNNDRLEPNITDNELELLEYNTTT